MQHGFTRTPSLVARHHCTPGRKDAGRPAGRQDDPMRRKPIDFRMLLERLLPLERLAAADRARVERALASDSTEQVERAGMMALHELERIGAIRRLPTPDTTRGLLRFQTPRLLDVITVELPLVIRRQGIEIHPRIGLMPRARPTPEQARRLMQLDDPSPLADPHGANPRLGVIQLIDELGCELTGATAVRFLPRQISHGLEEHPPLDPALALQARSDPSVMITCADLLEAPSLAAEGERRGIRSFALAGVFSQAGTSLGHLEAWRSAPGPFTDDDLAMLALLSDCCGLAWERSSKIEQLMFLDPMTGAFNRSYFDRQLLNEMARAARDHTSFALCLGDIDNF